MINNCLFGADFAKGINRICQLLINMKNICLRHTLLPYGMFQINTAPGFVNYKNGCTRLVAASDKAYQLLAHGRWFSPGTPASSTTKTGRRDIAEILLKVALKHQKSNQIKKSNKYVYIQFSGHDWINLHRVHTI